jgi:hypothetical protein
MTSIEEEEGDCPLFFLLSTNKGQEAPADGRIKLDGREGK